MTDTVSKSKAESKSEVKSGIGKIFMNGRSQAVRIPKEFRLDAKPGDSVRFRRVPEGIVLEPIITDPDVLFAKIDRLSGGEFLEEGRQQPPMPELASWDDAE
ncbi:MAG: antitoxin [Thermomicrobiales bacterium]